MPTAGLDAVSKVLAEPATVWLAFANLNAPPFAMSAKFQSPPGSADGAVTWGLGCTRGAAASGGGAAGGGAARNWGRRWGAPARRAAAAGPRCAIQLATAPFRTTRPSV